jgi:hypothetical protein
VFASGSTDLAPYIVRLDRRAGAYAHSFASYLMEDSLADLATTTQGDSVLALNSRASRGDITVLRIATR